MLYSRKLSLTLVLSLVICVMNGQINTKNNVYADNNNNIYDSLFQANDWRISRWTGYEYYADSIFGKGWRNKMLKVGDQMPDLPLGNISKANSKSRFSDFKGKLVILDFWSTSCGTCIAAFPKMEELQRRFGDSIQIILVNVFESDEEIKKKMDEKRKRPIKLPDLPSITLATHLYPYFPHMAAPHHVWIAKDGIIKVVGTHMNTYEKKIADFLEGKQISFLGNRNNIPAFVANLPYHTIIGRKIDYTAYNSCLTSFNPEYSFDGGRIANYIDSFTNTKRNTFINESVDELYKYAFSSKLQFPKKSQFLAGIGHNNNVDLQVIDTSRYIKSYKVDTQYTKSRFCYEQIVPAYFSKERCDSLMAKDLNEYFSNLYGTRGAIIVKSFPFYILTKLPGRRINVISSKDEIFKQYTISIKGRKFIKYISTSLPNAIESCLNPEIRLSNLKYKDYYFIMDEALKDFPNINITLPANSSIGELKLYLNKYGFDIIKKTYPVNVLQITDTKF